MAFSGSSDNQEIVARYMDSKYGVAETAEVANRAKGKNIKRTDWINGNDAGRQVKLDRGITASGAKETPTLAYR